MFVLILLVFSCLHDPAPLCDGKSIAMEITRTDAAVGQANGTITINVSGDASPYTFSLDNTNFQASNKFTGLNTGDYTAYVKNGTGCSGSQTVKIESVNGGDPNVEKSGHCLSVTLSTVVKNPTTGNADGSITASLSGGSNFKFSLNNGPYQSGNKFDNLAAGSYTVTAKSNEGDCTLLAHVDLTSRPGDDCSKANIVISIQKTEPATGQSNGKIVATVNGTGGEHEGDDHEDDDGGYTGQYTFSLNGGPFQPDGTFTGLAAGNYFVTAKNANGCTGSIHVTLGSAAPCSGVTIVVTATHSDPASGQSNGSIAATATGGTGFTYSLNGGTYQSDGNFTGLAAGNYTVTAKSADGCLGTLSVSLGAGNVCAGVNVVVTGTVKNATTGMSDGSITVSATGGTGFTYSLNNGAYGASGTFSSLAAGNYVVTAKNADGCTGSASFTVGTTDVCAGVTVVVTATVVDATSGSNGSLVAAATGGSGLTFSLNGGAYQTSGAFTGLAPGTYTVTAKNSNGCLGSNTFTIVGANPCAGVSIVISATPTGTDKCAPAGTGTIIVNATGSTGFSYSLNGAAYQTSNTFSALSAGAYTIGVKDANGCTSSASVTVATLAAGPTFTAVKALLQSRCSTCHTGGQSTAGFNFDSDCNIVAQWSGIYNTTINSSPLTMPISPQPALTAAEKKIIVDWYNAGHSFVK